ncbi:hypothetical protein RFI_32268, partial [Reticulomyxa filosa]
MKSKYTLKEKCHARVKCDLNYAMLRKQSISSIRCTDINRLIQCSGTVVRNSRNKVLESSCVFECTQCGEKWTEYADIANMKAIVPPKQCQNAKKKPKCKSTSFSCLSDNVENIDFQEITIQEQVFYHNNTDSGFWEGGGGGGGDGGNGGAEDNGNEMDRERDSLIPRNIKCILMCDLVDCCQAGDDIELTGIVRKKFNRIGENQRCDVELYIHVIYVTKKDKFGGFDKNNPNDENTNNHGEFRGAFDYFWTQHGTHPLQARNQIVSNICPQLCGMFVVKLAVALTIIGGVTQEA